MSGQPAALDRLRASRDISLVFAEREQRAGRLVVLHTRVRGDDEPSRLAVVASRRVGDAVRRNRAKRLLREAARTLPWLPGRDLVLVARAECATARYEDLISDLVTVANHLGAVEAKAA